MLKETLRYEDYDGRQVERTLHFHISKQEMVQLEFMNEGGLQNKLNNVVRAQSGREIMKTIEEIVKLAYGERRGPNFVKTEAVWEDFRYCRGWDDWFFGIVTDAERASTFVNSVIDGADLERAMQDVRARKAKEEEMAQRAADPADRYRPGYHDQVVQGVVQQHTDTHVQRQDNGAAEQDRPFYSGPVHEQGRSPYPPQP